MSRTEVIQRIRELTARLEAAEADLASRPEDSIIAVGIDAIRQELGRLGRRLSLA